VEAATGPAWSDAVAEADWIGARLSPFNSFIVTSVVPAGFDAYARVLHPAQEPEGDERPVRWSQVAAWSGIPLRRDSQFHSIALPPVRPEGEAPWSGQGPQPGSLYLPDAEVLAGLMRGWTATPQRCWFCVWEGYGWLDTSPAGAGRAVAEFTSEGCDGGKPADAGEADVPSPAPAPAVAQRGPRVHLPNRDYLLYGGPVEAVAALTRGAGIDQTPNLWWPADHAWCAASEIDLAWTYVGGPTGLIDAILADDRIEALPAEPGDPLNRIEEWVTGWVARATDQLMADGMATITSSRGTVQAWLERPGPLRHGSLRTSSLGDNGVDAGSYHPLGRRSEQELRGEVAHYLTYALIELVGG
jgi:hypothetical protein